MVWWHWLALLWLGLGAVFVYRFVNRPSAGYPEDDHARATTLTIIGYCAAGVAFAPIIAIFLLVDWCRDAWHGYNPFTGRVWSPERVAKFEPPDDPDEMRRDTLLCRMIERRRHVDRRLRKRKRPSQWLGWQLKQTPENTILECLEQYLWLRDGGLVEQIALEKLELYRVGSIDFDLQPSSTIESYLTYRLSIEDPEYVDLGSELLRDAIEMAKPFVQAHIDRVNSGPSYPPREWLKARVTVSAIENKEELSFGGDGLIAVGLDGRERRLGTTVTEGKDWDRVKLRMLPDDELWTFISPGETWEGLAGRMGVALVRKGRAIDHVLTGMN